MCFHHHHAAKCEDCFCVTSIPLFMGWRSVNQPETKQGLFQIQITVTGPTYRTVELYSCATVSAEFEGQYKSKVIMMLAMSAVQH